MGKSHVQKMKNWLKRLFGKRKKSAKREESGRVPENDVQVAQEPENFPEEVHLEQVRQHNAENMQQIEQLKTQLEINDQQGRQISDNQKNCENITTNLDAKLHHLEQMLQDNDVKYHEQIKSLLVEIEVKDNQHQAVCLENKVHTDTIKKLNSDLLCMEEQINHQKLQQNNNEAKLKEEVEMLSQMLSVKDQKFKSISLKNDKLSENLENVMNDLSEVESQLKEQRQQEAQHQQKDVESCKKIEMLSQRLNAKDEELKAITLKSNVLLEDLMNVANNLSEMQCQQEKVIESCQQIEVLSQRLSAKDEELKQITSKNMVLSDDLMKVTNKLSEVERQQQEQLQVNELQKQKVVEHCQQIEVLSQCLIVKDEEFKGLTSKNTELSQDLTNLRSEFYQSRQQLQKQLQRQEQIHIDSQQQVTLLMADFQSKNECLDAVVLKHNSIIEAMCHMHIKVQNLEQLQQQQPQQQPFSQLPFKAVKLQKPQTQQMYQNNLQRHQPQQNKEPRVLHHVSEYVEPLKSSSNAWRPTKKRGMTSDEEDIIRQFRSLLNKLTPENFDRIIHQMKRINITKEGHLKDIVQLVLNKAMMESKFSEVYANMCSHLSKIAVHETSKPGNILNFRILLIQGCQNEYAIGMDGSSSLDDEAFKEKARQRALGNVIFIGELFNAEVLHESVISDIVRELLKDGKEQSLEYLCRLLGVVGQNLDSKQPAMMNEYFTSLNELLKGKKMSSRIRFMLQDLIDLRKRKWISRLKVERPMYLQEVREEASKQQQ